MSEDFAKTQTSAELFGSFDEEEELDLQSEPHRAEMPTKRPAATIETVLPQEIVIHQEIIGISELIQITEADQIQYCDDAHQMPNKMHHETSDHSSHDISFEDAYGEFDESSVDTATLDFVSDHHGNPTQLDATEELADLRESTTDPDSATDPDSTTGPRFNNGQTQQHAQIDHEVEPQDNVLRLRHDDSDMLTIEDEVDIHRIDQRQNSVDANHQSIDYQRMLKRMRSKNQGVLSFSDSRAHCRPKTCRYVPMPLQQIAHQIITLADRRASTPVLVTPPYLSFRRAVFC